MSGAQEIQLTVRGDAEEAGKLLNLVGEIDKTQFLYDDREAKNSQETSLLIYAQKGADVREKVFALMAEHHIPVLELHTVTKSLEDVFLEITQDNSAWTGKKEGGQE